MRSASSKARSRRRGCGPSSEAYAYDAYSRSYDALYGEEQGAKLRAALGAGWSPGDRLVDFGCGTALLTSRLAHRCDLAVGLDASQGMLKTAKRRKNVELVLADAAFAPLRMGAFSSSCCFTSFHGFRMKRKALDEIRGSVREEGSVLFSLLARGSPSLDEPTISGTSGLEVISKFHVGNDVLILMRKL